MINIVTNNSVLLQYWHHEQTFPRWYKDSTALKSITRKAFLEFCAKCWRIYEINDTALLYCETLQKDIVNIHFSLVRGTDVSTDALKSIRKDLLGEFKTIYGWVLRQNRGLKKICRELGLEANGVKMIEGTSHNKPLVWECYMLKRKYIIKNPQILLNSW